MAKSSTLHVSTTSDKFLDSTQVYQKLVWKFPIPRLHLGNCACIVTVNRPMTSSRTKSKIFTGTKVFHRLIRKLPKKKLTSNCTKMSEWRIKVCLTKYTALIALCVCSVLESFKGQKIKCFSKTCNKKEILSLTYIFWASLHERVIKFTTSRTDIFYFIFSAVLTWRLWIFQSGSQLI